MNDHGARDLRRTVTFTLGGLGLLASHALFARYMQAHGLHPLQGWQDAFSSNDWSLGFHLDLVACTLMVLGLAAIERKRLGGLRVGAIWLGTILGSVSVGLAIYLVASFARSPSDQGSSTSSKRPQS